MGFFQAVGWNGVGRSPQVMHREAVVRRVGLAGGLDVSRLRLGDLRTKKGRNIFRPHEDE